MFAGRFFFFVGFLAALGLVAGASAAAVSLPGEGDCDPQVAVTSAADSGTGTLRWALGQVCGGGRIVFALELPATITLTSGELVVDKAVTIVGPGAESLAISGNQASRVFRVSSVGVILARMTIRDGAAGATEVGGGGIYVDGSAVVSYAVITGNMAWGGGGGLYNDGGPLTITHTTIANNSVGSSAQGGGVQNVNGTVSINDSVFSHNVAPQVGGGGIYNSGGIMQVRRTTFVDNAAYRGGGIKNYGGELLVYESEFRENDAIAGGAISNVSGGYTLLQDSVAAGNTANSSGGGVDIHSGEVEIRRTAIQNNEATAGGGVYVDAGTVRITQSSLSGNVGSLSGAGIYLIGGQMTIENSAISQNVGQGIYKAFAMKPFTFSHSVVAGNTAQGVYNDESGSPFTFKNSIVAYNGDGNCYDIVHAVSLGYNISSDGTCNFTQATDFFNTDPLLGPLADNGGPTETQALLAGSVGVDAGTCLNIMGDPVPFDQRGVARPKGAACDIGAVEMVEIADRLDYDYWLNDGRRGSGCFTLLADATYVDESGLTGMWAYLPGAPEKIWLRYGAGLACDALSVGQFITPQQVRGVRLCRDGSGAAGVWVGARGYGDTMRIGGLSLRRQSSMISRGTFR